MFPCIILKYLAGHSTHRKVTQIITQAMIVRLLLMRLTPEQAKLTCWVVKMAS